MSYFPALIVFALANLLSPRSWRLGIFAITIAIGCIGVLFTPTLFIYHDGPPQRRLHLSQVWPTALPAIGLLCFTLGLRCGGANNTKVPGADNETDVVKPKSKSPE